MKITDLVEAEEKKITSQQLLKRVTDALSSIYKVVERERSAGAEKAWLDPIKQSEDYEQVFVKQVHPLLKKVDPKAHLDKPEFDWQYYQVFGKMFQVELRNDGSLFVSVYRRNRAGAEYSHGIDS